MHKTKLTATTSLNDAVKRMANGNMNAATVLALILKEFPDRALPFMREMDMAGMYGPDIWWCFSSQYQQNVLAFLKGLSNGIVRTMMDERRKKNGVV